MSVTRTYHCSGLDIEYDREEYMTDEPLRMCSKCSDIWCVPKRIINCKGAIHFRSGDSGGWSGSGYSKSEPERRAEHQLGRKLTKSEK
jgi:hypothetical protein